MQPAGAAVQSPRMADRRVLVQAATVQGDVIEYGQAFEALTQPPIKSERELTGSGLSLGRRPLTASSALPPTPAALIYNGRRYVPDPDHEPAPPPREEPAPGAAYVDAQGRLHGGGLQR